jgi:hypothetical protein
LSLDARREDAFRERIKRMSMNDPNRDAHGASKVTPLGDGKKKGLGWLPWLIGALLLLGLLLLLMRGCGHVQHRDHHGRAVHDDDDHHGPSRRDHGRRRPARLAG